MNLLTKLLLLTITTIAIALILLTLVTPLNILIVTLLIKLKENHLQYLHHNYITARNTKGERKNSSLKRNQLDTQASHLRGMTGP